MSDLENGDEAMPKRFLTTAALMLFAAAALLTPLDVRAGEARQLQMWRSAGCSCCGSWAAHMEDNGFAVAIEDVASGILARIKRQAGLTPEQSACHTARIGGYVIEGHVPAADVERLLAEQPDAVGLAVPGMPVGSPGMERGGEKEPYEVLLVKQDGATEVFARHGQ